MASSTMSTEEIIEESNARAARQGSVLVVIMETLKNLGRTPNWIAVNLEEAGYNPTTQGIVMYLKNIFGCNCAVVYDTTRGARWELRVRRDDGLKLDITELPVAVISFLKGRQVLEED